MARPGVAYPQVEAGARSLATSRVVACPAPSRVASALRRARLAGADVVLVGADRAVRRRDLERLARWGFTRWRVADVALERLPALAASAPEIQARRLLIGGAPLVLVRDGRRAVAAIDAESTEIARPALSLAHRLDGEDGELAAARVALLRRAGEIGRASGQRVFAVGGYVRDLLLGRPAPDVDLLVEGDGAAFSRRLADAIGGSLAVHEEFGTASIEGGQVGSGPGLGRVDIASARGERYDRPGQLPSVAAATVEADLWRRDFSVNAMALALDPIDFGRLLDPAGGRRDLEQRRLRPLAPLSFVEDPTRIFRAARYAARLRLRLDRAGRRALALALDAGGFPALSGHRLRAELRLLAEEPTGWRGLALLLRWRALAIWDRALLPSAGAARRLHDARRLADWARGTGLALDPGDLAILAILADQRSAVWARCLERLGMSGEPLRRLLAALATGPLSIRLGRRDRAVSDVADVLRPLSPEELAGVWLRGGARARRRVEWFVTRGRSVRPLLSGDEVVGLGVPRGPAVGECLDGLRRLRLDGRIKTREHERAFVAAWREDGDQCAPALAGGGGRANRKRGSM